MNVELFGNSPRFDGVTYLNFLFGICVKDMFSTRFVLKKIVFSFFHERDDKSTTSNHFQHFIIMYEIG